ncbi:MAG: impB/mucB/samB family protein [Alphaproteobacteria bacterium]|nr:impB/mucB/samB family protein [Alphaproteobacteria bacterium]
MTFEASPPRGVRWLFLDLNSYFASCEQQEQPHLRGKPVAVVPMPTDATCAIAASVEAKAYGIKTGTSIWEAKERCPALQCVLARHDLYVRYHHRVIEEVARHTPIGKVWSIDEMASKLLPLKQSVPEAMALAQRIKDGLRRNVGECITCSIGLAPNAWLAKVASDMQKPNGLVVLEGQNLPEALLGLELQDLCGIGANMAARLNRAGIWTMRQLWDTSPKQMRAIWKNVEGERFWYRLHGYDVPDLETGKSVVGHSRVLDFESRRPDVARDVCRRLTVKACQRLRRYEMFATHFYLSVRLCDGRRWGHDVRVPPSADTLTFVRLTHALWDAMTDALQPDRIKKVSITLMGLQETAETTGDLFEVAARKEARIEPANKIRSTALSAAMDQIARAYGPHAVHFGNQPQTQAGFVGTKIAFSRVPDLAEFTE